MWGMTIPYESTRTEPLLTDAAIESRAEALVGRACRRQLWLMFLDDNGLQLPLIIPVGDHPSRPEPRNLALFGLIETAMCTVGAESIFVVFERYASSSLTTGDIAWAHWLHENCDARGIRLRGQVLSHRSGVRWIAQDDYRFGGGAPNGAHPR